MNKLTAKQQSFIDEYIIDKNATKAAIRAGYSKKTAYSQGQRLLKNVEVIGKINDALDKVAKKSGLSAERIAKMYKMNAILAQEKEKYGDSNSALRDIAKHLGRFDEDNKQKQPNIDIALMTTEQLLQLARGGQA